MASHWNSKYAIWRDLSVAQGREVPAQIDHTVAQDERPPRLVLPEETEEEFYGKYVGGGDDSSGPDLELIQKMLQEVSVATNMENPETDIQKKKPAKSKNLAIESLLQMYDESTLEDNQNHHFFVKHGPNEVDTSPVLNTTVMFKKKEKERRIETSETSTDSSPVLVKSDGEPEQPKMFVPSSRATEYCNMYRERSRAAELAREDIWSRAERMMRELDRKRQMNAVSPSSSSSSEAPASLKGMDLVRLSAHRHTFTDIKDCVVCKVLCKQKDETLTQRM